MPIYEYYCNGCQREFTVLLMNWKETRKVICKFCNSNDLKKLYSAFSVHQTEESRLSGVDTSKTPDDHFYRDSRNIGLRAKKRLRELGVDMGSKIDEIVERGRSGKILDDYQK